MRVVLAFGSSPDVWTSDGTWPGYQCTDRFSGKATHPDPGGRDLFGQSYMLYLAYAVNPTNSAEEPSHVRRRDVPENQQVRRYPSL